MDKTLRRRPPEGNKALFPKGRVCIHRTYLWPAIVMQAPRGKNDPIIPYVEVFGVAHEIGSAYCSEYLPCTIGMFEDNMGARWFGEKRYFKGKLIG